MLTRVLLLLLPLCTDGKVSPEQRVDHTSSCGAGIPSRTDGERSLLSRVVSVNLSGVPPLGSSPETNDAGNLSLLAQAPETTGAPDAPQAPKSFDPMVTATSMDMIRARMKIVVEDAEYLVDTFLPGLSVPHGGLSAVATVVVALIWFSVFLHKFYRDDREDNLSRWAEVVKKNPMRTKADEEDCIGFTPDLILVVRANDSGSAGAASSSEQVSEPATPASPVSRERAGRILLTDLQGVEPLLPRVKDRLGREDTPGGQATPSSPRAAGSRNSIAGPIFETLGFHEAITGPSKESLRRALLQDLTDCLPRLGFEVRVTCSVDGTQRLVHVALKGQDAIAKYLTLYNVKLQLQPQILQALGVSQPAGEAESSPPVIRYDRRIVESLYAHGVIQTCAPDAVYRTFRTSGSDDSIVPQTERFRIIYKEITDRIDVEAAKEEGLIDDIFPAHDEGRLKFLRAAWLDTSQVFDSGFRQPMYAIKGYFGSQLAFSFLLIGFYGKMLLALIAPALIYELAILTMSENRVVLAGQESRNMLGFSIILVAWGQIANNLWHREESFFNTLWNLEGGTDHLGVVRAQFQGEYLPSPVDTNLNEKQCRPEKALLLRCLAQGAAATSCLFVMMFIFVERILMGTNIWISSYLAIQMLVLEYAYDYLAGILTAWENHKTHSSHYNSLLWKQAIFQSVNHYYPFLHLIIQQSIQDRENCYGMLWVAWGGDRGGGDCLSMLRAQISTTLFFLSTFRVFQAALACARVKLMHWFRKWQFTRRSQSAGIEGLDERPFVERQIDYVQFDEHHLVWMMLHPVLSLGHVLLFGAAAPFVVILCFVVFAVNLRASAFLIAHYTQRPLPVDTLGIGEWREVINLLMKLGACCTGFLLVTYGESFHGTPLITRVSGFLLFLILTWGMQAIVHTVCPQADKAARLLAARRHHSEKVVVSYLEKERDDMRVQRSS
mmetsp:Transcript_60355/g.111978  ORF Transcript_60355/g.111978 Transcript_60355/m.111978 type:complete len:949 (-) Transcript_60355:73-2919(-)